MVKLFEKALEWTGLLAVMLVLGALSLVIAIGGAGWTMAKFAIAFRLMSGV